MQQKTPKNILVTGGAGYIGSAIAHLLVADGHTVVVYDDLSTGKRDKVPSGAALIQGDMTDTVRLETLFRDHRFDAVIHCAAKKSVNESEREPTKYFRNNVTGTLNLLDCMERHQVPQLIFSSTAAVYAPTEDEQVTEFSSTDPVSVYGRSKLMSEMLIKEYARLERLKCFCILRYFNVAGDAGLLYREDKAESVFPLLARAIEQEQPFFIFGDDYDTKDGSGVRDYIHLTDLARAHVMAIEAECSETFNLGTSAGYTVKELVSAFEDATGKKINVQIAPRRAGDLAVMLADSTHARDTLGWQPTKSLTDMVQSTIEVYGL